MSAALPTIQVAKPWGREVLPAPFTNPTGDRVGEIWFEPPAALRELLVKYIFTSEKLSVQVHPSDEQTLRAGLGRQGKEECWLVIEAEPDARLAIGFAEEISRARLREAALDGSIEDLLAWHPVRPGDFFYIPANTVHAIGAGISLIEVQQNSDITYRLFDYGRPRQLHLEDAVAVARRSPYNASLRRTVPQGEAATLVDGPLFRLDQLSGAPGPDIAERYKGPLLVVPLNGDVHIGGEALAAGQCGVAREIADLSLTGETLCLIAQALR